MGDGVMLGLLRGCVCDTDDGQPQFHKPIVQLGDYEDALEIRVPRPKHLVPRMQTYSSSPDQPLLGVPIREGTLWHLSAQDRFESVMFSLYVNGFAFSTLDGREASVSLSPFSLIRNCRFQSGECSRLKSFKVSLQEPDPCCYFAVRSTEEREAEEERSEWVLGLSHTILLIIDSLLPVAELSCDPVPGCPQTQRRLLAGYLIHRDDAEAVSVVYCELQAPLGPRASLVMYENELCKGTMMEIAIFETSVCCDVVGINCSCFVVEGHHFACQSSSERKLWLRALSNLKVKLQNKAPEPSAEELLHFRSAIRENIVTLEATQELRIAKTPLLKSLEKPSRSLHTRDKLQAGCNGDEDIPEATGDDELSQTKAGYGNGPNSNGRSHPVSL